MTEWVIKVHNDDDPKEEYLHHWRTGFYEKWVDMPEWVDNIRLAYRFTDRNYASRVAYSGAVQNYHDNPQIVRVKTTLVPARPNESVSEGEEP